MFITIEGIEGAGKSTAANFMHQILSDKKIPHIITREPGGTAIAESIRQILLHKKSVEPMCSDAELLLMFASRAQHLAERIIPALNRGSWVICDRFTDATYAYQGAGRRIDFERISKLEELVQGDLRPDYTLLLDIPAEVSIKRIQSRRSAMDLKIDRMEQENIDFFERVRQAYLDRARLYRNRFIIIDATRPYEMAEKITLMFLCLEKSL